MKLSNQFISGIKDKKIIIRSMNQGNKWIRQQQLIEHCDKITCLVVNNNEDFIISRSNDSTIKFWEKNIQWSSQQIIQDKNILDLSMNQQQNKVISCGKDEQILIIEYSQQNSKWGIIQIINETTIIRICIIDNDLFLLQQLYGMIMDIYQKNNTNQLFEKSNSIISLSRQVLILYLLQGYKSFPLQFIKSKGLVLNKIHNQLQFLRRNENGKFEIENQIKLGTLNFIGKFKDDGQYLFTWESDKNKIQIRKYHGI